MSHPSKMNICDDFISVPVITDMVMPYNFIPSAPYIRCSLKDKQSSMPVYHPDKEPKLSELPLYSDDQDLWLECGELTTDYLPIYYGYDVEYSPTWKDDLEAFVMTLDPDNLELPNDFDPSFCDPSGRTTLSCWIRKRPGTPLLMELVDSHDFEEYHTKCSDFTGITPAMYWYLHDPTSGHVKTKSLYKSLWVIHRDGEPIPSLFK